MAGALALPAAAGADDAKRQASGEKVHCYGINKCKGTGDCGGPGHSCAGHNTCRRQGFIELDRETCLRIEGGRLTAMAEKADKPKAPAMEKR